MRSDDLYLRCTCFACPEQYDVVDEFGSVLGYIRYRWDYLYCSPVEDGHILDSTVYYWENPNGDGWGGTIPRECFDEQIRLCKKNLARYFNSKELEE